MCLKHLPNLDDWNQAPHAEGEQPPRFHHDNVPWQRVVNAKGGISPRWVGFLASFSVTFFYLVNGAGMSRCLRLAWARTKHGAGQVGQIHR